MNAGAGFTALPLFCYRKNPPPLSEANVLKPYIHAQDR